MNYEKEEKIAPKLNIICLKPSCISPMIKVCFYGVVVRRCEEYNQIEQQIYSCSILMCYFKFARSSISCCMCDISACDKFLTSIKFLESKHNK